MREQSAFFNFVCSLLTGHSWLMPATALAGVFYTFLIMQAVAQTAPHVATHPIDRVFIASAVEDSTIADTANKSVVLGTRVQLYAVVHATENGRDTYLTSAPGLRLDGRIIPEERIRAWDAARDGDAVLTWYKVESQGAVYSNDNARPGWWDAIAYVETPMQAWGSVWEHLADAHPVGGAFPDNYDGLGTMRFKVEVTVAGRTWASPGREAVERDGIRDEVLWASFWRDNTFVGHLTGFLNLPYIWGSESRFRIEPNRTAMHQAERRIGADCADFIVAGRRAMGYDIPYGHARRGFLDHYTRPLYVGISLNGDRFMNGRDPIPFGAHGVQAGDLFIWGTEGGHVGAVYADSGPDGRPDGIFNKYDLYIDTIFSPPKIVPFGEDAPTLSILRWDEGGLRNNRTTPSENEYEAVRQNILKAGNASIEDFQRKHGLAVDGIVGRRTKAAFDRVVEPGNTK